MTPVDSVSTNAPLDQKKTIKLAADKLEAQFLAEMLKASGVGQPRSGFGGGIGEEQFSSFLADAYAKEMVQAGGLGLSDAIYASLLQRSHEK